MNNDEHFQLQDHGKLAAHLIAHINVKLALIGCQPVPIKGDATTEANETFTVTLSAPVGATERLEISAVADAPATERLRATTSISVEAPCCTVAVSATGAGGATDDSGEVVPAPEARSAFAGSSSSWGLASVPATAAG